MRPTLAALALLLALTAPTLADEADDLAALAKSSLASADPSSAFYAGLAEMGDFSLGKTAIQKAIAAAQLPTDHPWAPTLTSIVGLEKQGAAVWIERDRAVLVQTPGGWLRVDDEVSFVLEVDADGIRVEQVQGVSVGMTKYTPYPVRSTLYTQEGGKTVAKLTVGTWPLLQTFTQVMEPVDGITGALD